MTKLHKRMLPDVRIEPATIRIPGGRTSDRATVPGQVGSEDWSDWVNAQADLCLHWAHRSFCWFCHVLAHIFTNLLCFFWNGCPFLLRVIVLVMSPTPYKEELKILHFFTKGYYTDLCEYVPATSIFNIL